MHAKWTVALAVALVACSSDEIPSATSSGSSGIGGGLDTSSQSASSVSAGGTTTTTGAGGDGGAGATGAGGEGGTSTTGTGGAGATGTGGNGPCTDADCLPGSACCGGPICLDLSNDPAHCGACNVVCPAAPNAPALCAGSTCALGPCAAAFADCNADLADGCEWNTLEDGPCVCAPGEVLSCYSGELGSENIGPCTAGVKTCNADGVSWSACVGQVLPAAEVCNNALDDDCDGFVDNAPDVDNDGWTACDGDCEETTVVNYVAPKHVNPGAFEIEGNGVDDDCDPSTLDDAQPACNGAATFSGVAPTDAAAAMDLCQTALEGAPLAERTWGLIGAEWRLADGSLPTAAQLDEIQSFQAAVVTDFGTGGINPKKGPTMAAISTGRARDAGDPGFVAPDPGVDFGRAGQPPAVFLAAHGGVLPLSSNCAGSCPSGSGANDSANLRVRVRAPTNASAFHFDFHVLSAAPLASLCTLENDHFLALLSSAAMGLPPDRNVAFGIIGEIASVNSLYFRECDPLGCQSCLAGPGLLLGTGFEGGAGTGWLALDAPVVPGEIFELDVMAFDVTSGTVDSTVLLDNFGWWAQPCYFCGHNGCDWLCGSPEP